MNNDLEKYYNQVISLTEEGEEYTLADYRDKKQGFREPSSLSIEEQQILALGRIRSYWTNIVIYDGTGEWNQKQAIEAVKEMSKHGKFFTEREIRIIEISTEMEDKNK